MVCCQLKPSRQQFEIVKSTRQRRKKYWRWRIRRQNSNAPANQPAKINCAGRTQLCRRISAGRSREILFKFGTPGKTPAPGSQAESHVENPLQKPASTADFWWIFAKPRRLAGGKSPGFSAGIGVNLADFLFYPTCLHTVFFEKKHSRTHFGLQKI